MDIKHHSQISNSNSFLHGGNLEQEAKQLGIEPHKLLDASASMVPFSAPKELLNHLIDDIHNERFKTYPDRSHSSLKKQIANWHCIEPEMVLPGNGAAELITWCGRDASINGSSGLPAPCFSDYERAIKCWEGRFTYKPLKMSWDTSQPNSFPLKFETNVVWITNPHNPTGQLWDIKSLIPLLEKHQLVICDEAFLPLVGKGEKHSLIPLIYDYKNLIVIRSLTKLFAIPGLRLGYVISTPERLKEWQEWRDPWPINSFAISAGEVLMKNQILTTKWMTKVQEWISKEGPWLFSKLGSLPGITSYPSSVNFQLIKGDKCLNYLRKSLAYKGILVRDCQSFKNLSSSWLRISLQKKTENKKIYYSIREILKQS
ncbi:pyridoxal phosphate-dependent aminotransferase [Prochlorococcus sp. MIT 1223]|uniref:pyridoxal phosphate-dependent aminotransferase n=1 Tax=Prochlorococcus sp. MIT 1223 TaxID=3096217 RepID=UPI002A74F351|nr:aminotransferase class I/II-fold pyridoxal phosphate-dependent enzyme [Prochlorococcus sp. MIT 1223]